MDQKPKSTISKRKFTHVDRHEKSLFLNEKKDYANWDEEKKEVYFQYIVTLIKNPVKNFQEIALLKEFLSTLTDFTNMLKSKSDNYSDLINNLSVVMTYERILPNRLIFRTGDIGDKFYLILRGKVGILLPKDEVMDLTEDEYYIYLTNLRKYEEYDLLNRCIIKNKNLLPSVDMQDFDRWLLKQRDINNKRKLSNMQPELIDAIENAFQHISEDKDFGKNTFSRKSSTKRNFDHIEISVENYINRIKPVITNSWNDRLKFTIFNYFMVTSLNTGKHFGDLALITYGGKRSASIITLDDSHFSILNKVNFDKCLKFVQEKEVKNKLNLLSNMSCFEEFSLSVFKKKYLNLFVGFQSTRGNKLIIEGENSENIYFIKDGEYEIKFRRSLVDLNQLIIAYGGKIDNKEENDLMSDNGKFKKFMHEKKQFRLSLISNVDILGLNDMTIDGINIFTVETNSSKGEYFILEKKFFKSMYCERSIRIKTDELIKKKKQFVLERLISLKESKVNIYKNVFKLKTEGTIENKKPIAVENDNKNTVLFKPLLTQCLTGSKKSIITKSKSSKNHLRVIKKKEVDLEKFPLTDRLKDVSLDKAYYEYSDRANFSENKDNKNADSTNKKDINYTQSMFKVSCYESNASNLMLHRIRNNSNKSNTKFIDFLAMDSFSRNVNSETSNTMQSQLEYFNDSFIKNLKNSLPNVKYRKNKKEIKKCTYYSNYIKMNMIKTLNSNK